MPYHITPVSNLPRIMREGLIPQIGDRSRLMEQEDGIYLFPTYEDAENALMNWLGYEFPEGDKLALLEVNWPLPEYSTVDYEFVVKEQIPPDRIKVISEDF
jgi:hypothetical protein